MNEQLDPQIRRFYDGGPVDGVPDPDPDSPPTITLEWTEGMPVQEFRLTRRIAYLDRELGELLVPADPMAFATDMASVPSVFTWLVPRSGHHLPAALVHDGLVGSAAEAPTYISSEGVEVGFEQANRVFRDAMADAGTGFVRRWLMWTACTLAVMVVGDTGWSSVERWRWRVTAVGTLALLVGLGLWTTSDLLDVVGGVPWMGEGPLWSRLLTGAAGAVAIPLVVAQAWGRFRWAGMIAGTMLALLLHVTIAVAALTGLYRVAEWLCATAPGVAAVLGTGLALAAGVVFVVAL